MAAIAPGGASDGALESLGGERIVGIAGEIAGQKLGGVDEHLGIAGLDSAEHFLAADHHDIAADDEIGAAGGDADGVDVVGRIGDADMAVDRAALLRQAGHIDDADALAFQMRGHAENAADGNDAGAADTGDDDAVGVVDQRHAWAWQCRPVAGFGNAFALLELGAVHGHERRAETVDAGIVLVAARLIDGALAAPFGHQRLHRHAIRFHAAVAAAFADQIVDDHALIRVGEGAALAAATLLGGAGLVVNEDADARHGSEFALQRVELVAMMHGQTARPVGVFGILPRLVGDDDDAAGAFGGDLAGDLRHVQAAFIGLPAGHRHRVVEQDLVGHLHATCDRRANGEIAGVVVGAVAEILKHMVAAGKRRLADPVGALAAHLGVAERLAVHPLRHIVTADAGIGAAAFRHASGCIVRAA